MIRFEVIVEERGYKVAAPSTMLKSLTAAHYNLTRNGNLAIADYLYRAILRRVPVATGFLKRNIQPRLVRQTRQTNIMEIISAAPYTFYQEFGYTHVASIPIDYILQHMRSPGSRGDYVESPRGWVYPTKYTPFIRPAHMSLQRNIGSIWKTEWYKEMKKQGMIHKKIKVR